MKQAFHIFRKDARRFALQICALAAATAVWAWANISASRGLANSNSAALAGVVLIIGWWYLISLLVHEESLTGDRQFWITRPYSRQSLVAAKLLFVVAFLNVPLLLAGFAILASAGYRPLAYLPNFFWMQLTFTAAVLLLPAALAALTRTLGQFVLVILGLCVGFVVLSLFGAKATQGVHQSNGLVWAAGIFLLLLVAAPPLLVFVVQLHMRNRLVSVGAGVALLVLMLFTDESAVRKFGIAVQSRMFGQDSAASLAVVLDAGGIERASKQLEPGRVTITVPLRVAGIQAAYTAAPEAVELTLETPAGRRWSSGWIAAASSGEIFQEDPSADGAFVWNQRVVVDRAFWRRAQSGPVTIRGAIYVKLFGRRSMRLEDGREAKVPGGGQCSVSHQMLVPQRMVECLAPFHMAVTGMEPGPETRTPQSGPQVTRLLSVWDSPLPADFGMNPLSVQRNFPADGAEILFVRYDPRAYILRTFEAANVHLPR